MGSKGQVYMANVIRSLLFLDTVPILAKACIPPRLDNSPVIALAALSVAQSIVWLQGITSGHCEQTSALVF